MTRREGSGGEASFLNGRGQLSGHAMANWYSVRAAAIETLFPDAGNGRTPDSTGAIMVDWFETPRRPPGPIRRRNASGMHGWSRPRWFFFFFFFLLDFRSLAARELLVQKGREESRALPRSSSSESLNIYFILFAPFVATTCIVTIYIMLCRVFHDQSQLNTRRSVFFQLLFTFREAKIYFPAKELT